MSWRYNIVKEKQEKLDDEKLADLQSEELFSLREVYYNDDKEVCGMTMDGAKIDHYENVDALINDLKTMLADAERSRDDVLDSDMDYADWGEDVPGYPDV